MDYSRIEKKWQQYWEDTRLHSFNHSNISNKYYVMEMLPYPSGANLHLGHWYNYGPSDSFARFKKMQGYEVFQPMGFDAFGLPAENYAIKTGIHPKDSTYKNIRTMEVQLKNMGTMFDWDAEIKTCEPDYYRWTQWLFLQFFKNGLAYRKQSPVNWCGSCNTVIANEQVIDGGCERCGTTIERRNMNQWFFKITNYADELLEHLDNLDWPEKTKLMQRNWIGRSTGGEVDFVCGTGDIITVFTTRADTLPGVSFVVIAPEHPLVSKLTTPDNLDAVTRYCEAASHISDIDRLSTAKEKTGSFTGSYAINPFNGEQVPVYVADYVLYTYGTGAVMGVAAHDTRDYDFAAKYSLSVKRVVKSADGADDTLPYTGDGVLVNCGEFDGLSSEAARTDIIKHLESKGQARLKTNFRLRDWSVSRQRFWGCPIPVIHCDHCGVVPVPEDQLPVELPYDVNFTPDGQSPLRNHSAYSNVKCPVCGRDAHRDHDTLDTFVCSSWYFLRYPDAHNSKAAFDTDLINKIMPVDKYIGGAEHACMHLLYARFFTKALRDMGLVNFDEPFKSLVHQGLIMGPDGFKMSKSRGNIINPDSYVTDYGSDVFRMYLMFGFSYIEGGPWSDDGIKALSRFAERIERIVTKHAAPYPDNNTPHTAADKELLYALNYCIKEVTKDLEAFSFNTAIARMMELINAIYKYDGISGNNPALLRSVIINYIRLLAPFAPHISEELYSLTGHDGSIFLSSYPVCDPSKLLKDEVEIVVQFNGKVKHKLTISSGLDRQATEQAALSDPKIIALLDGATPKKVIVVPAKLVNIVV